MRLAAGCSSVPPRNVWKLDMASDDFASIWKVKTTSRELSRILMVEITEKKGVWDCGDGVSVVCQTCSFQSCFSASWHRLASGFPKTNDRFDPRPLRACHLLEVHVLSHSSQQERRTCNGAWRVQPSSKCCVAHASSRAEFGSGCEPIAHGIGAIKTP
jgi:hypothetical protein